MGNEHTHHGGVSCISRERLPSSLSVSFSLHDTVFKATASKTLYHPKGRQHCHPLHHLKGANPVAKLHLGRMPDFPFENAEVQVKRTSLTRRNKKFSDPHIYLGRFRSFNDPLSSFSPGRESYGVLTSSTGRGACVRFGAWVQVLLQGAAARCPWP